MELAELKQITAANLITLRSRAGYTQAELGAMLNYSDKNISKWERGESMPDAYALTRLAELYGVKVDEILSRREMKASDGMPVERPEEAQPKYSAKIIISIAVLSVMTAALTAFVILWILGNMEWRVFLIGISVSLLAWLVLDCVFFKGRRLQHLLSGFIISLFVCGYCVKPSARLWQLFLLCIPAVALVYLGCHVKVRPGKRRKDREIS